MLLVISPHLDDAVLSCGRWLAAHPGATVLTVFAGAPADAARLTDWDARCGFASAGEAVLARREEDRIALGRLGAVPAWLHFLDAQYEDTPAPDALSGALSRVLAASRPGTLVLYPLGLFHSDHFLAHEASRRALQAHPALHALAYEDVPYRGMPGRLQQRLAALAAAGTRATPARLGAGDAFAAAKDAALKCYASQWRAFGEQGLGDARQPERFWRLAEAPTDG